MASLRKVTGGAALAAALALAGGAGCVHVHTDADGKVKSVELKGADPKPAAAKPSPAGPKVDPAVVPAVATVPAPAPPAAQVAPAKPPSPPAKLTGGKPAKTRAGDLALTWQPRLGTLPDPARNGAMGVGLVGQMYLLGPNDLPVAANGKLTVELFEESGRGDTRPGPRVGGWTIDKETLKRWATGDERFGKSYALFLPWPDDVPVRSRVRVVAKYEPDGGYALFSNSTLTIDTSTPGDKVGPGGGLAGLGQTPPVVTPAGGFGPPPPAVVPPLNPLPVGGGPAVGGTTPLPPGLTPIVITAPARR